MSRWGMVIDLDRCTACGGCVAACHQENNLVAVGEEETKQDRAFHWIRMLRESSEGASGPSVRFLPQPCFQCLPDYPNIGRIAHHFRVVF